MEEIFGKNGLIAKSMEGFEYREGQLKMAEAVMSAFDEKEHLVVEAATGTGKTLAYLVPAIAAALGRNERIIISTGTKNLQEQLMEKDLPLLHDVMPKKFSASYLKGRANYACLFRIAKAEDKPILDGLDDLNHFDVVRKWARETSSGDRAELTTLPEHLPFWSRINAKGDVCLGQKCPDFEPCFVTRMRQRAEDANIVIVNHHLFFADLNLRGNKYGRVLPDYSAVIFDEAHLIEDIASEYFGSQVSNFQIDEIVRDTDTLPITDASAVNKLTKLNSRIARLSEQFFSKFSEGRGKEGRFPLTQSAFLRRDSDGELIRTPLGDAYFALDDALEKLIKSVQVYTEEMVEAESVHRRLMQTRFDLEFIARQDDQEFVYWVERRGRGLFLRASPIDVSGLLEEKLFDQVDTCVLTSATLSTNGKFDFIKRRLGLDRERDTRALLAPSSFDYKSQALIYLPKVMPDPRSPEFTQLAAGEIEKLLRITEGRAFVLATSNYSMNALYELVRTRVDFPCLVQGSMSKTGLLERFRATPNSVLFATSSFWQGVDVRGEQLSCVIIDKLPFSVPSDPVVAARTRFIDQQGGKSFFEYSVPNAIIALKQGVGRLIRSKTDRGVIALLDSRLRTKSYGRAFLNSLPNAPITTELNDVRTLFEEIEIEQANAVGID